jgi:hypothetical protein
LFVSEIVAGPIHAYLAHVGRDSRGRLACEILNFSDEQLETTHDYIQWLFPLPTRSAAQPHSPVLSVGEIEAIRADLRAGNTLQQAADRMVQFYRDTNWWLTWEDHNHLRITRIIKSLNLLKSPDAAKRFHGEILALHNVAGAPVNSRSLAFWAEAAGERS